MTMATKRKAKGGEQTASPEPYSLEWCIERVRRDAADTGSSYYSKAASLLPHIEKGKIQYTAKRIYQMMGWRDWKKSGLFPAPVRVAVETPKEGAMTMSGQPMQESQRVIVTYRDDPEPEPVPRQVIVTYKEDPKPTQEMVTYQTVVVDEQEKEAPLPKWSSDCGNLGRYQWKGTTPPPTDPDRAKEAFSKLSATDRGLFLYWVAQQSQEQSQVISTPKKPRKKKGQ
jgi:hypothetical protein